MCIIKVLEATEKPLNKNNYYNNLPLSKKIEIILDNHRMNDLGNMSLKVISNGYAGSPKSFFLGTSTKNYLFNIGEGFQRLIGQSRLKITSLSNVFLTRKSLDCIGGFVGATLTLRETLSSVRLHGPFDIQKFIKETFPLGSLAVINITQHDYEKNDTFKDEIGSVKAILLNKNVNKETEPNAKRLKVTDENVYSYLVKIKDPVPKLSNEKLIKLKIPDGPLCGLLKKGESVTLPDGKVVNPEDVRIENSSDPIKILVLDCPDEAYFDFIESNSDINDSSIRVIAHLSNSKILANKRFQEWIKSKNNIKQIIFDERLENSESQKRIVHQKALNLLDKEIYPMFPAFEGVYINHSINENIIAGNCNLRLELKVPFKVDKMLNSNNETLETYLKEYADPNIMDIINEFRKGIEHHRKMQIKPEIYPIIKFLGTGGSTPQVLRNSSGILVALDENTNILLDCGESTISQLMRLHGNEGYKEELMKLKAIFISHLHADHILGVFGILNERQKLFDEQNLENKRLFLCVPANIVNYFKIYCEFFDKKILNNIRFIYNTSLYETPEKKENNQYEIDLLYSDLNLQSIITVPVQHIQGSNAVIITTNNNNSPFKLVFSGDCRPSDLLASYGTDCDVLIHESNYGEKLKDEAIKNNHSTILEAIKIGKRMKAKLTILWHFSQRYPRIPNMNDICKYDGVGISFDNMVVRRCDLELIPKFNDVLKSLFAKDKESAE